MYEKWDSACAELLYEKMAEKVVVLGEVSHIHDLCWTPCERAAGGGGKARGGGGRRHVRRGTGRGTGTGTGWRGKEGRSWW